MAIWSAGSKPLSSRPWILVLAGGVGRRLRPLTRLLTGRDLPKQYCAFGRGRSLLQQTLDRVRPFCDPTRLVLVATAPHGPLAARQIAPWGGAVVLEQPADRGTAAGVLLPLVHVVARDPDAAVILLPSDQAVADNELFRLGLRHALRRLEAHPTEIIVGGVAATRPATDFGWIVTEQDPRSRDLPCILPIRQFVEKPPRPVASELLRMGGLWSTFIVVARARTLHTAFVHHLPRLAAALPVARGGEEMHRPDHLQRVYARLRAADFSADLLTDLPRTAALVWPAALGWADLGTPDRLLAWLDRERVGHHGRGSAMPTFATPSLAIPSLETEESPAVVER